MLRYLPFMALLIFCCDGVVQADDPLPPEPSLATPPIPETTPSPYRETSPVPASTPVPQDAVHSEMFAPQESYSIPIEQSYAAPMSASSMGCACQGQQAPVYAPVSDVQYLAGGQSYGHGAGGSYGSGGGYGYTGAYGAGTHARHPYYSYRHPWYYNGPASQNVTIVW